MLSLVPSLFLEERLLQVHGLSYIYIWSVNHHNGSWGILEAPLPWCLNLLWPSIHEWLFFGLQGKCDPESCCRLPHWYSLLLTHYRIFHHLQFMYRSWQNKQVKRNASVQELEIILWCQCTVKTGGYKAEVHAEASHAWAIYNHGHPIKPWTTFQGDKDTKYRLLQIYYCVMSPFMCKGHMYRSVQMCLPDKRSLVYFRNTTLSVI